MNSSSKLALHLKNRGKQHKKIIDTSQQNSVASTAFNPFPHISAISKYDTHKENNEFVYFSENILNTENNTTEVSLHSKDFLKRLENVEKPENFSLKKTFSVETTDTISKLESLSTPGLNTTPVCSIKETPYRTIIHNNALLVSNDYGASWNSPVKPPSSSVTFSFVAVGEKVQVSLGRFDPIYHSLDNGETWAICSNQPQIHDWAYVKIYENDDRIEAGTTNGMVYVSTDLGYNWSQ